MNNIDPKTVASFGDEWSRFDQSGMGSDEAKKVFDEYFSVFPWDELPQGAEGFDMGCGSGRWARWVSPRVGRLHCIDPSDAIDVARVNLVKHTNVICRRGSVDNPGIPACSQDFGYSLGVLHHVPDTAAALQSCVNLLKPRAPFLLYLYYALDNRSWWFKTIWRMSDMARRLISLMPVGPKNLITAAIAGLVYWPLARLSLLADRVGLKVGSFPLSYYRNHSFYTMLTDARDRFGTPLERRFTKSEIGAMMQAAGLVDIEFSSSAPFWCAVGLKG